MRLLGLDVGSKTVGVAISDELGITAQKLETIQIDESRYNFGMRPLKKLVRQYEVDGFVLGLPKNMDGTSGSSVARSKAYGKRLEEKFGLPVHYSDELGITAQKLETIQIDESRYNFGMRPLKKLVRQYEVDGFVLGLPKNMDGTSGSSVARSKAYGKRLEEKFGLPVHYSDERLTTIESRRVLVEDAGIHDRKKRKQVIDQMAAVLILQNYLDLHRKD